MSRNLRIITGLLLYFFVACHLLNVSLGIFSAELVEQTRPAFMYVWASRPGGTLLLVALLVHGALGLKTLYWRNTLQMSFSDSLQFASGFLILPLMIPHVWGVVAMNSILDTPPTYPILMQFFWIDSPLEGLRQVLLIIITWVHGSIGVFTWLQLKPWWPRAALFAYPLLVLIPVMALLGFVEGGNLAIKNYENSILQATQDDQNTNPYSPQVLSTDGLPQATLETNDEAYAETYEEKYAFVMQVKWIMIYLYTGILFLVLLARWWRLARQKGLVKIIYEDGTTLEAVIGKSFLELSQMNNIPHANLCKGRGRCGTCRIRIESSTSVLPEPTQHEIDALVVTNSQTDIRLACQCVPGVGTIHIERLFQPDVTHGEFHGNEIKLEPESSQTLVEAGVR